MLPFLQLFEATLLHEDMQADYWVGPDGEVINANGDHAKTAVHLIATRYPSALTRLVKQYRDKDDFLDACYVFLFDQRYVRVMVMEDIFWDTTFIPPDPRGKKRPLTPAAKQTISDMSFDKEKRVKGELGKLMDWGWGVE
jgi:hypothetical protein